MKKKRTAKANPKQVQDTDVAIGERIRARRNQIEMSQEELGDALNRFRSMRRVIIESVRAECFNWPKRYNAALSI
jgi:ribosome-binding protein aMBF1 (putative translation factor)